MTIKVVHVSKKKKKERKNPTSLAKIAHPGEAASTASRGHWTQTRREQEGITVTWGKPAPGEASVGAKPCVREEEFVFSMAWPRAQIQKSEMSEGARFS